MSSLTVFNHHLTIFPNTCYYEALDLTLFPFPLHQNDKGQVPADVVPDPMDMSLDKAEAAMVAKELKQILLDAVPLSCNLPRVTLPNYDNIPGNLMLSSLGLKLGDRVVLDDMKVGAKHRKIKNKTDKN